MAKKPSPTVVKEGEIRRFRCKTSCYWNNNLWTGEDKIKLRGGGRVSEIQFKGPTEIPANFQFENWEEF